MIRKLNYSSPAVRIPVMSFGAGFLLGGALAALTAAGKFFRPTTSDLNALQAMALVGGHAQASAYQPAVWEVFVVSGLGFTIVIALLMGLAEWLRSDGASSTIETSQ